MARTPLIAGIDIGSAAVRIVAGQFLPNGNISVVGVAEGPSEGVSKGVITSLEDAVSSVSTCLERLERMTGVPVEQAFVSVGGTTLTVEESRGVIAVARADGEIREADVARVIEAAEAVATPPNAEIIHVIPKTFTVDGQSGIRDPLGMSGVRLEVVTTIIEASSAQVRNLTKCVDRAHLGLEGLVAGGLALAEAVTTRRQRDLGVALVNMGSATTTLTVFEEGDVLTMKVFPVGSRHVTSDIAIGLRTSIDVAEEIKLTYGTCMPGKVERREEFDLAELSASEHGRIVRREVAEIISARVEEVLGLISDELERINRVGKLPAGVILSGGGVKLPAFVELTKQTLRLPAVIGVPVKVTSPIDHATDPAYATVVGLLAWAARTVSPSTSRFSIMGEAPAGFFKRALRHFLP